MHSLDGGDLSDSSLVLLDTSIVIIYAREGAPSRKLEEKLGLHAGRREAVISTVTIGETLAFARKRKWSERSCSALRAMLRDRIVSIDINRPEILDAYVDVSEFTEQTTKPARRMAQNDMWIASTALALRCPLVTTDRDFEHLRGMGLSVLWIDQSELKG